MYFNNVNMDENENGTNMYMLIFVPYPIVTHTQSL